MKINIAKSAGFCFGVKRAIKVALEAAKKHPDVIILGDIVHNEVVIREIKKSGIKKITKLKRGNNQTILIRAHGTPQDTIKKAASLGYNIIDATCPMVKEIHKIAQGLEKQGYKIIVIGDRNHDEVMGILGNLKNQAIIISNHSRIPITKIKNIKKAAVVVQSTQNLVKTLETVDKLKAHVKHLKFCNTICNPTKTKQAEIREMPKHNDLMIVIGSKTSANTKRLYEISKSINKKSFWVTSKKDVQKLWFKNVKTVGVTSGASTPDSLTQEIITSIKKIKPK